jgi:hypothetical protein
MENIEKKNRMQEGNRRRNDYKSYANEKKMK